VFLTYQYGLRPKRHQYPRPEAILEGQRLLYAIDPEGYGALPVTLFRWSLNKVDEASLLPSHQGQARQGRLPALQIEA
jgi:hypothetical protein